MFSLSAVSEIERTLLSLPVLVAKLDHSDPNFVQAVRDWLQAAEAVMVKNRSPVAGELASLRTAIIAAEKRLPSSQPPERQVSHRKMKQAAAAEAVRRASDLLAEAIRPAQTQHREAEKIARQLLAVAEQKQLIRAAPNNSAEEVIAESWIAIRADADLCLAAAHLVGLLGLPDAMSILAVVLPDVKPPGRTVPMLTNS